MSGTSAPASFEDLKLSYFHQNTGQSRYFWLRWWVELNIENEASVLWSLGKKQIKALNLQKCAYVATANPQRDDETVWT
ncbi:uncharacterized [Tachysurus ichikawai]